MGAVNLPFQIANGDGLDADAVMADYQAIVSTMNGLLEAASNVRVLAPPVPNVGNQSLEGSSAYLSRADHQHIIQGVENVSAIPTSGNFLGRLVYVTSGVHAGKLLVCTNASVPTFLPFGGAEVGADLPIHATEHKDGGHDPLADNTLSDHMFAAKGTIFSATLASDHPSINGSGGWSTIVDLTGVTTTGSQTLGVAVTLTFSNTDTQDRNGYFRVVDVTDSNTTIWRSDSIQFPHGSGTVPTPVNAFFYYSTPSSGPRTLRVAAGAATPSVMDILATANTLASDTVKGPTISAVVL